MRAHCQERRMYVTIICFLSIACYGVQVTYGLEVFSDENDKIDLRRVLDEMTQNLLVTKDPFYHSYVFGSGVGNREKVLVEWMRQEPWFTVGEAVLSWQGVRNIGQIYLLGQKTSSVTLVTADAQLSSNGTVQIQEHSISFGANVTSTSIFTRWNPYSADPEVVVAVALDTSTADIVFCSVNNGKLDITTQWSRYKKVSRLLTVNVNGKSQLIVIDKGNSPSVEVFEVLFLADSVKLDFRLVQSFAVSEDCSSATVCRVGQQHYLVLALPASLVVYRLVNGHYNQHTELLLPHVSQVVCFSVALQTYLAVNGESAHVLRLTEAGEFVSELMPGNVKEWLVLPVASYRSDVLLLSRTATRTQAYVWAGTNRGFDDVAIPQCDSCLDGDWLGAVSVPFQHQNYLLIPQVQSSSKLIGVGTSLNSNNPVMDKLSATIANMKKFQDEWWRIKSRMAEVEETLQFVLQRDGVNEITGRWTIEILEVPSLKLSSVVKPENETNVSENMAEVQGQPLELEALETAVETVMVQAGDLINAVVEREKEAWGLDGFKGKVMFNNKLFVEDLTISKLNGANMEELLRDSFRRNKPEQIKQQVVVHSIEVEEIVANRINNFTKEDLKFADGPVVMKGDVTLERPLTVRGEVRFVDGGRVNGVDLSEEFCPPGESCSVFPVGNLNEEEIRNGEFNNNIDKYPTRDISGRFWNNAIAGRNLTVVKINGVDWTNLRENVIFKDIYQIITGVFKVKGNVTSEPAIWADSFQYLHKPQSRDAEASDDSPVRIRPPPGKGKVPPVVVRPDIDNLPSTTKVIVSELEVTGTVSCGESEWGAEAADVVVSDANPIVIEGAKIFQGAVKVTNNAEVEGTVGGVVVADLLTSDTDQVFHGPSELQGNITADNMEFTGTLNGRNLADVMLGRSKSKSVKEVMADTINVLNTVNGIPVSDLVFTKEDGVANIKTVNVDNLFVTKDIVTEGKVCGFDLDDFNERRLSLQKEQNISGKTSILNAKITEGFQVKKLNNVDTSSWFEDTDESGKNPSWHLSELHVDGDIATEHGVNGVDLVVIAENAVWLKDNNDIEGPLIFKDEVTFSHMESQHMCNQMLCSLWLDPEDVVYKNNKSVTFTGEKKFVNLLNISGDLTVQEINNYKVKDFLTKTTEQEITGDLIIDRDVRVENLTVLGLLNELNISEMGQRCSLNENSITCKGNTVFKEEVVVEHFKTAGKMNDVEFESFLESVVRVDDPQKIKGLKKFTGNIINMESVEDVNTLNGVSWDGFLSDAVNLEGQQQIDHPVTFSDTVTVSQLSVDHDMEADTINSVNITRWKTDAIYINESHALKREIRLESASSKGNLSVEVYGGLDLEHDVIRLHAPSSLPFLRAKSVTVVGDFESPDKVNGEYLTQLEQNTLKISGDQIVQSDLIMRNFVVEGDIETEALVNERDLRDVVTLTSNQQLDGKYEFDCIVARGNVNTSDIISGINLTSWKETGVVKDGRKQVISGAWRVQGTLGVQGPVVGSGRLGDVHLQKLTDNITRDLLDIHAEMKRNLTKACTEANVQLTLARGQVSKLQYLDISQSLLVPSGPSLVAHFKDNEEDFLAISENSCVTTIYKWNKSTGTFNTLNREKFGFALKTFIILTYEQFTYVLTESSEVLSDCEYSGKHLWIFIKDHFKHISSVGFFPGNLFQGEGNTLYMANSSGMYKFALVMDSLQRKAFFKHDEHLWNISTDMPKEWYSAVRYEWLSDFYTASNCSGKVVSVSVDPSNQFVAVASTEDAQVPKHADDIKVYRRDGQLFDKLPVLRVVKPQWLSVPGQTWLVALHNYSTLDFYQLQGPILGFQLQVSVPTEANDITTVVLPVTSRVNLQPFLILQTPTAVRIMQAVVQGDPYLGKDLTCSFDQVLSRVPRK